MQKTIQFTANASPLAKAERKMLNNEEHLVFPVIAIKEGVLNNLLYTAEELSTFAAAWNGVPVPVEHPTTNGVSVSANAIEFEETVNIGKFYNVNYDTKQNAIKGEIWINISKADELGFTCVVESLENGDMMEVSTGLFSHAVQEDGEYNGKSYSGKATGIRPDHLALLPDSVGACSIADGCGAMRTHKQKDDMKANEKFWNKFKGFLGIQTNEISHDDIRSRLSGKLREMNGDDPWPYILDVFDNHFVYELGDKLFKRNYTIDSETGEVLFLGDETQVYVQTEYVSVTANTTTENHMKPEQNGSGSVVDALIANGAVELTTEEQETLKGMDSGLVSKIIANAQGSPEPTKTEPKVETPEVKANGNDPLSTEDRQLLNQFKANEEARVNGLRKQVADNYPNLGEDVVANMDKSAIEALADAIPVTANRAVAPGAPVTAANAEEGTYEPPAVLLANDED